MRLGNSHRSGLQEDDHLIIAPCTGRTRLVGMIFDCCCLLTACTDKWTTREQRICKQKHRENYKLLEMEIEISVIELEISVFQIQIYVIQLQISVINYRYL